MKYRVGSIIFDHEKGDCRASEIDAPDVGNDIRLEGLNLLTLKILVTHYPNPVSAEQLAREVWQRDIVSEDTITKRISLLRNALSPLVNAKDIIRTLPNRQYQLIGPVETIAVPEGVVTPEKLPGVHTNSAYPELTGKVSLIILSALTALIVLMLFNNFSTSPAPVLRDPETGHELVAPD